MTIKVSPISLQELYVEWKLEGETFNVFRSTSPNSGYELVGDSNQPFFIDKDINLYDNNVRYYYRVEGYVGGSKVSEDGPATLQYNAMDNVAGKVIYESKVVLRAMNNPPVFFLLKKRVGVSCPECWNSITKKVRYANCSTCNGTGIVDGYHEPIASKISQDMSQLIYGSGEFDGDNVRLTPIRAWITNTPLLYPEDVMVDILNQRYKVVNVGRRTKSQYVIRQVIDLLPLEKGHPAYQVEVDREEVSTIE